jgi:manganese transport protein
MALSVANTKKSYLILIHVLESPGGLVYGESTESLHLRQDEAYLEELAREVESPDLPVEIYLRTGNPVQVIITAAKELDLDMLIMGSHGHKGLSDIIFGETVHGVRHALDIPVLLVRVNEAKREKPLHD